MQALAEPESFGESLYADAAFYDRMVCAEDHGAEIAFYASMAGAPRASILELGCGTGRLTLPLAAAGHAVTGIDNAPAMLAVARRKAAHSGKDVRLVQGDIRDFAIGARFRLIIFPHNSIGHLHTLADQLACLHCVREHLRDDGWFVIDMYNPLPRMLSVEPDAHGLIGRCTAETGEALEITETSRYDDATQMHERTWHVSGPSGLRRRLDFKTRVIFPQELETLLCLGGWRVEAKYGSYAKDTFGTGSLQQLIICSKAAVRSAPLPGPRPVRRCAPG
jgi:SAM-dependent methyltransferase